MLSINQKHSFCRCVQWRFSFVQTIATSSRSVCWPVKVEFFASLRQFCAFKISTKQSLPFSQMILQFFCRFLNVTLFSRGHAFLFYKWESMFVGCSFGAIYTSSRQVFLNNPVVPFEPMAAIPFGHSHVKILPRCPGKVESDAVPWYNGSYDTAYVSVRSSQQCKEIQGKLLFDVF